MPYTVTIGGSAVSVVAGSLKVDLTIGKRSQASFIAHTTTSTHFQQYQQVSIKDQNNVLVFSGYITSPKEQKPGFRNSLLHTVTCTDQHFLADKRIVSASYTNKTCGFIVYDLINTILSGEGVTVGQIVDGWLPSTTLYPSTTRYPNGNIGIIPSVNFNYCTVAAALDALVNAASSTGVLWYWQIDQNKKIYFVPYTTITNSATIDGTKIEQKNTPPTVTRANPSYRNTQYVIGGTDKTITETEVHYGDGLTQSWTMGYPLVSAPNIQVNGVVQTIGTKGSTGKNFYWAAGDQVITQDRLGTVLQSTDYLQVIYSGKYPIVAKHTDASQVTAQAAIDGTSGIIEHAHVDTTIDSLSSALTEATALEARYGVTGTQLVLSTMATGYAPGQLVPVNLSAHNLPSVQMLIESVSITDLDGINIWYTITAVLGPYDISWIDFFSRMFTKLPATVNSINVAVTSG